MSDWLAHYGRKGMKWHKHIFGKEASASEERFGKMETRVDPETGMFVTRYVDKNGKEDIASTLYTTGESGVDVSRNGYYGPGNARYLSGQRVTNFLRDHRDVSVVQATANVTRANVTSIKRAKAEILMELGKGQSKDKSKPVGNSKEPRESATRKKVRYMTRRVFGKSNSIV